MEKGDLDQFVTNKTTKVPSMIFAHERISEKSQEQAKSSTRVIAQLQEENQKKGMEIEQLKSAMEFLMMGGDLNELKELMAEEAEAQ